LNEWDTSATPVDISNFYETIDSGSSTSTGYQSGVTEIGSLFSALGSTPFWSLYGTGDNTEYLLFDGLVTGRSSPVQLGGSKKIKSIGGHCIGTHAMFIDTSGYLWGIGSNDSGQLGTTVISTPYSWSQISAGEGHMAAIRSDGLLFTWGDNTQGQLGIGPEGVNTARPVERKDSPVQVGTSSWSQVACGNLHTLGITADKRLFAWGYNFTGLLGFPNVFTVYPSPNQVGTSSWTSIAASTYNSFAIRLDGRLFAWGENLFGELGINAVTTTSRSSPVQVGTSSWTQVACGSNHVLAIRSNGSLFTWGYNASGQLGTNNIINRSSPVQVGTSSWTQIAAGNFHSLAIRVGGDLFTWGSNFSGGLGDNTIINRSSPVQIGFNPWSKVSGGHYCSSAVRFDGLLFTWGENAGQLGNNTLISTSSPIQIGSSSWTSVSTGSFRVQAAIQSDGKLYNWGINGDGQLGQTDSISRSSPVQIGNTTLKRLESPVQIGSSKWTQVSAGLGHTLAIRSDGFLFGWGANGNNQAVPGVFGSRSSPVQIGSSKWVQVSAALNYSMAIRMGGNLFAWGFNNEGALGTNSTNGVTLTSPTLVGSSLWTQVKTGNYLTAAIRSDGLLFTWGNNGVGQLGDGTTIDKSSPVQIGSSTWSQVACGPLNTLAIRSDNLLYAWGNNTNGRLGDGTVVSKSSPTQIGSSTWTQVSLGNGHSAGLTTDNRLFAWGLGNFGQLDNNLGAAPGSAPGFSQTPARSSPIQIGSSTWTSVAIANNTTYFLT
jgi:alpha-tubulin suppressor-like RCC1 family protein